jgi:SET domain-containing protein
MLHIPGLFIAPSEGRGNGMFTAQDLAKGDTIEVCPYISIPANQLATVHETIFHDYYFLMPNNTKIGCLILGYGSVYNHNSTPNAEVIFDLPNERIEFQSMREIEAGEEIFIDYTGGIKKATELWFKEI